MAESQSPNPEPEKTEGSKRLRLTDYQVPGTSWTLSELCKLAIEVDGKMSGARWEVFQASADNGALDMTLQERFAYLSAYDPPGKSPLFGVSTKTYKNQECMVAYCGHLQDNAVGLSFLRNNVAKLAKGCVRSLQDLGQAWDMIEKLALVLGDDLPDELRKKIQGRVRIQLNKTDPEKQ